jgi:hypothetical protein
MLENIIKFIKNIFILPTVHDELEAYIVAGNPQDTNDVDRLERQFYESRRRQSMMFFHE